jgi:hypothetical protein
MESSSHKYPSQYAWSASAAARKLLTIIFVLLKKELDYWYLEDPLYSRKLRALSAAA